MFCDISPTCYKIALQKEICKRHIKDFFAQENYADTQDTAPLPCIVAQYSSHLIKRGKGIDPVLQENKAVNIRLANERLNGILIRRVRRFPSGIGWARRPSARATGMGGFWCVIIFCRVSAAGCATWQTRFTALCW